jgi:hypothetical protein
MESVRGDENREPGVALLLMRGGEEERVVEDERMGKPLRRGRAEGEAWAFLTDGFSGER